MRVLKLECRLDAPVEALWPQLLAVEAHAPQHRLVQTARVVSGGERDRVTEWALLLRGSPLRWSQVETIDPAARSVSFRLRRGDPTNVAGTWSLRPDGGGAVAEIGVEVDFGLPRISAVFDALLAETLTDVLRGIARSAESTARGRATQPAGLPVTAGRPVVQGHESEAD